MIHPRPSNIESPGSESCKDEVSDRIQNRRQRFRSSIQGGFGHLPNLGSCFWSVEFENRAGSTISGLGLGFRV